jgi:hypothetical protein
MNPPISLPADSRRLLAWALLLFAACLALDARHRDFPFFYHPDEPGKVEQVLKGDWNFHHPMLLLATARVVVDAADVPRTEQAVVEAGRLVSATFMAIAVVALSLLAYAWRGWPAALAAGGALAGHHQLFELAHYFKEDSALLAGLALTFLMLLAVWWHPTAWRVALLGVACGLAVSGKYLGVVAFALAVPVLWQAPGRTPARFVIFAAAALVTFCVINLPLLRHLATFEESFGREMQFVVHGQRGMTRSIPHAQYWNVFIDNTTPAIWVLLLVFLRARWRERQSLSLPERMIIGFPFAYGLLLSFSPKSNDRYFLPASALFTLFAALGTMDLARHFERGSKRRWVLAAACVVLLVCQLVSLPAPLNWKTFAEYSNAFQSDDTQALIEWLRTELPPTAVLAKDGRIEIPETDKIKEWDRPRRIPQKVLGARFAADLGTPEELLAKGVTHVVVSESDYGRFFLPGLRPQPEERRDFERRKAFYERLLRDGEPLFERERGTVIYLHPGIRVYRLSGL